MIIYHVECNPEETLLLNIGLTREVIEHHSGSGTVCKILSSGENLFGLIDEDPEREFQHPYYLRLFQRPTSDLHSVRYSFDKERKNKMIFIKPRFEPWIINVAQQSNLQMEDYNLSADPGLLHREINFKRGDLQRLLHRLIRIESPAIIHLRGLINPQSNLV